MTCMDFPPVEGKRRAWADGRARLDLRVCCRYGDELDELIQIYPPCIFIDLIKSRVIVELVVGKVNGAVIAPLNSRRPQG